MEHQEYAEYGSRSRLPTPAALAGLVIIGLVAALIVGGFVAGVILAHRTKLTP